MPRCLSQSLMGVSQLMTEKPTSEEELDGPLEFEFDEGDTVTVWLKEEPDAYELDKKDRDTVCKFTAECEDITPFDGTFYPIATFELPGYMSSNTVEIGSHQFEYEVQE